MNSTTTKAPIPFGRLDWNISGGFLGIFGPIVLWCNNVGFIFEITVLIFFIRQFTKKESNFKSAYYIIYFILCLLDGIYKSFNFILIFTLSDVVGSINGVFLWYLQSTTGFFHLVLALNRFSAVVLYRRHKYIWTRKFLFIVCALSLLHPFIIHVYCPQYIWQALTQDFQTVLSCRVIVQDVNLIVDAIYSISATIVGIIAALFLYSNSKTSSLKNQHPEITLLFQSIFTSLFFVLSVVCRWALTQNTVDASMMTDFLILMRTVPLSIFLSRLSNLLYVFYHYAGVMILILFSKTFRAAYFSFYKVTFLINLFTFSKNNTVFVIQSSAATHGSRNRR